MLDVKLSGDGKYLFAATFGRSVWKLPLFTDVTDGGGPGGSVPATLALSVGPGASFGAFTPGVAKDYTATRPPTSSRPPATPRSSVTDPGHLMNGTFALPSPLEVSLSKATWTAPVSHDPVDGHVQTAHRRHRRAADRQLLQDADVHALDDEPVM